MDSRPAYLHGRGRGRGRGSAGRGQTANAYPGSGRGGGHNWNERSPNNKQLEKQRSWTAKRQSSVHSSASDEACSGASSPGSPTSAQERFAGIAAQHQESVQRHLSQAAENDYESSSEEEDLNDESILTKMVKTFRNTNGTPAEYQSDAGSTKDTPYLTLTDGGDDMLGSTHEYLLNSVKSKANVCLVCIETIRRTEAIWSCAGCFTSFHISCVQKWVKDGVYQQTKDVDTPIDTKGLPWHCPKCRHEYKQIECPTRYLCFCGKEENPSFDPWLVPHSCGQTCEKQLRPECGHRCLLLCHPGPCPPCPQTVRVSCYCKQQPPQTRRCGAKEWSCGQPCGEDLACGQHECRAICHPGECPACPETSEQPCACGNSTTRRPCAQPEWHCDKVCGRNLSCGHHVCEAVCHSGDCGPCPRSGKRTCPCGKSEFELPCTEDVPTCFETCDKLLQCELHKCTQRCHTGPCGTCRQSTQKTCRCGQRSKELPCFKDYTCETKCTRMKDCHKHACKKKCCDGQCQPCEQPCNKMLGCRNHKCASRCHRGPCYPCPLTMKIACNCGATSITVPCGRERVTRPPRCSKPCQIPPDCHHPTRTPHRCHFRRCPPCRQICNKGLSCKHVCPVPCHSAVLVKKQEKVERAGPWDPQGRVWQEIESQPCPPCQVPVKVSCLGGHEVVTVACAIARVSSCHRPCGRVLACCKHECELECHMIEGAADESQAGTTCQPCERTCEEPRPDGCSHACLQPCHPGECPPCRQMIRMRCHCQLVVQHIECHRWTEASDRERQKLKACPSRCPKMLPCKHQCTAFCHPGKCPSPEKCTEKVKVRCPCRSRKREFVCNEVQCGYAKVECDDVCHSKKEKQQKEQAEKEALKREQEEQKQREELEEFQKKMKGKRRKPRVRRTEELEPTFLQRYRWLMLSTAGAVVLAVFVYWLLGN